MLYTIWFLSCDGCSIVYGGHDATIVGVGMDSNALLNQAISEGWKRTWVETTFSGRPFGEVGSGVEAQHFCPSCVRGGKTS